MIWIMLYPANRVIQSLNIWALTDIPENEKRIFFVVDH